MKNIYAAFRIVIIIAFFSVITTMGQNNLWQRSNFPSFFSGYVESISARDSLVFATLWKYSNGWSLVRSTNSGLSWESLSSFKSLPQYVAVLYSGYVFVIGQDSLYRSTDDGNTWLPIKNVTLGNGPTIISGSNGFIYIGSYQGVFRSTDSGTTWTLQNNGLIVGGDSPWTLIAINTTGELVAATPTGIFRSTDNAASWIQLSPILKGEFITRAIALNSAGYIFASGDLLNEGDSLYRSTDNGASWQEIKNGWNNFLFIDPATDALVAAFLGEDQQYFLSTDNGTTWNVFNTDGVLNCMTYNGNSSYYLGIDGKGISKSTSLSGPWQLYSNGLPDSVIPYVSSIFCTPTGTILAGTKSGLYSSTDDGKNFNYVQLGQWVVSGISNFTSTSDGRLFAIFPGGIGGSSDFGNTWYSVPGGDYGPLYGLAEYGLCAIGKILITGGDINGQGAEIMRSPDSGVHWSDVFYNNIDLGDITVLAANSSGTVLAGTSKSRTDWTAYGLLRSSDYGMTWEIVYNFSFTDCRGFAWDSQGGVYSATSQGVQYSTDDGLSWSQVKGSLPTSDIRCIAINSIDDICIGSGNAGIFSSTDHGNSWKIDNNGLTDSVINTLSFDSHGYLYAGTENGGIYKTYETTTAVSDIHSLQPREYILSQNYPNPFNPTTVISWQLAASSFVTLKVYDILGRDVKTLVNEQQPAGTHYITFNAESLPSGVYFYRIKAGNFIQTKKLQLMK